MTTTIQKWGNSLAIRIPKNIVDQLQMEQNSEVELFISEDTLVIKPTKKIASLDELLSKITDENRHNEIDFQSEGKELL